MQIEDKVDSLIPDHGSAVSGMTILEWLDLSQDPTSCREGNIGRAIYVETASTFS